MQFVKFWFTIIPALCLALSTSPALAVRIILSPVGPPPAGSPTLNTVPMLTGATAINVTDANPTTLHVWITPDGVRPPNQLINTVALDLVASAPGIVTATAASVMDADNTDAANGKRWEGFGNGTLNTSATTLVDDFYSVRVSEASGIGNSNAANSTFAGDAAYDAATRSFYWGSVSLRGVAAGTVGLYFRTADQLITLSNGTGAPVQFGASSATYNDDPNSTGGLGDPIDPVNFTEADAVIQVNGPIGGNVSAMATAHALGDLTPGVALLNGSPQRTFVDVTPNVSMGRININNFHGQPNGDLTVFFDLANDSQAAQLVTDLNGIAGRQFTASLSNFVGVNPSGKNDGDIALTFAGRGAPGSSQFIDFDFGAGVLVQAVGIPEPSTYVMASLGLLGLAVYARRRAA